MPRPYALDLRLIITFLLFSPLKSPTGVTVHAIAIDAASYKPANGVSTKPWVSLLPPNSSTLVGKAATVTGFDARCLRHVGMIPLISLMTSIEPREFSVLTWRQGSPVLALKVLL